MPKDSLNIAVIDNGGKMAYADWGYSWICSLIHPAVVEQLSGRQIYTSRVSYGYNFGAMNIATEMFRQSKSDRLIVVDLDQDFTAIDFANLLSHDVAMVSGMYVKKQPGIHFTLSKLSDDNPFSDKREEMEATPLIEVAQTSRGFINIHRSVFDLMESTVERFFDEQTETEIRNWWKPYQNGHSEDFAFCDRYRALGGKVYVDQRIRIGHWGPTRHPIPGTYSLTNSQE